MSGSSSSVFPILWSTVLAQINQSFFITVLNNLSGAVARSRLSGFLIGLELSAARPYWLGQDIAIIGAEELSMAYIDGLISQGVQPQSHRSVDMTLAGLTKAYQQIQGSINAT